MLVDFFRRKVINSTTKSHYDSLDSLRGLAAIIVCGHHYFNGLFAMAPNSVFSRIFSFILCDRSAVILFFVLSGYVLSLSLMKVEQHYWQFLSKRLFRIMPAYWVCMIFVTILVMISDDQILSRAFPGESIRHLNLQYYLNAITLISSIFYPQSFTSAHGVGNPFNSSSWSLVYEILVSICFPALFVCTLRRVKFAYILSIVSIVIFYYYNNRYTAISYYSCFFLIGALVANYEKALLKYVNNFILVPSILFFMAPNIGNLFPACRFINAEFLDIVAGLMSAILILSAKYNYTMRRVLELSILKFYGKISYSFYLFHIPCSFALICVFTNMSINTNTLLTKISVKVFAFILSTIISWCVFCFVEKKCIKIGADISNKLCSRIEIS